MISRPIIINSPQIAMMHLGIPMIKVARTTRVNLQTTMETRQNTTLEVGVVEMAVVAISPSNTQEAMITTIEATIPIVVTTSLIINLVASTTAMLILEATLVHLLVVVAEAIQGHPPAATITLAVEVLEEEEEGREELEVS